jgi:TorA maturation chaperone TorD
VTDQSTASFAAERSKIYWLLSRFYLEQPDRPFIGELQEWLEQRPHEDDAVLIPEFDKLSHALHELRTEDDILGLQKEFTRLFGGLRKETALPPPFESVFREGRLAGDVTVDVDHHYRLAGYGEIHPEAGPQDHLGVELRYMSLLCYDEHVAFEQGDVSKEAALREQQRTFLDRHLLKWAPDYCAKLAQEAHIAFYSAIAAMTAYSLKVDTRLLERMMAA